MKLKEFLVQVFGSEADQSEFDQLSKWKEEGALNADQLREMLAINRETEALKSYKQFNVDQAWKDLEKKRQSKSTKKTNYISPIVIAGLLALGIFLGLYLWNGANSQPELKKEVFKEYVAFQKIDGSVFQVKNNAEIKPLNEENTYQMEGNVYFDIEKQETPMKIHTQHGKITVLGTSFDVQSNENATIVTMHSGIIDYTDQHGKSRKVEKGETIIVEANNTKVINKNNQVISYWRTKTLNYNHVNLNEVLADINQIFDTTFDLTKSEFKGHTINTTFKSNNLNKILAELEIITGLKLQ